MPSEIFRERREEKSAQTSSSNRRVDREKNRPCGPMEARPRDPNTSPDSPRPRASHSRRGNFLIPSFDELWWHRTIIYIMELKSKINMTVRVPQLPPARVVASAPALASPARSEGCRSRRQLPRPFRTPRAASAQVLEKYHSARRRRPTATWRLVCTS